MFNGIGIMLYIACGFMVAREAAVALIGELFDYQTSLIDYCILGVTCVLVWAFWPLFFIATIGGKLAVALHDKFK